MKLKSMPEIAASRSRSVALLFVIVAVVWSTRSGKELRPNEGCFIGECVCRVGPVPCPQCWLCSAGVGRSSHPCYVPLYVSVLCKDRVPTYYGLCAGGVTRWPLSVVRCEHHSKIIWMKHSEILCSTQNRNVRTIYMYCVLLCPAASRR